MDDITRLFGLSLCMLVGCYVAGAIPLAFAMSEKRLRMVSVLGAGLLVGTALAVIIPEGVHALYAQQTNGEGAHSHSHRHLNTLDMKSQAPVESSQEIGHVHKLKEHISQVEPDLFIGMALCFGFVFMLLVDHISGGHSHGGGGGDPENNTRQRRNKMTATIGLVVHAAADGIALGAAVSTSKTDVEMIIFLAIMLHKAPAAFGLSTFLLHEGLDRNRIRRHLVVFAAAAPIMALVTFFGLGQSGKEVFSSVNGTGFAMLFSAGTFLYVATVHVLPEIEGHSENGDTGSSNKSQRTDLILMVCGICAPLLLSQTHSH
ncbi:zinc transporter ZIP9 [Nematostella vectensis]|uniref:zinc transporter ZIP9 n=1 Tax=Nematostella vectensis TaxID=45351 RepID=UPI00138FB697|nr:zinc transporter ZIP9 [Nematostella vectensis]